MYDKNNFGRGMGFGCLKVCSFFSVFSFRKIVGYLGILGCFNDK